MKVTQVSVFMENTPGRLAEVTKVLGDAGINILALTIAETGEFGILRMIVQDWKKAVETLKENDFTVTTTEVLAVEIPHEPGSLSRIVEVFDKEEINIEYVYAFVAHSRKEAVIIMRFENVDRALEILAKNSIKVLSSEDVIKLET